MLLCNALLFTLNKDTLLQMSVVIPNRSVSAHISGGADLVSCGGSGLVRLWNTQRGHLVGQFAAHNRDLGSVVMTVSPCGKYLVTADKEGTIKTWDIKVGFCDTRCVY